MSSFDQLSSLESGSARGGSGYSDNPEFKQHQVQMREKLGRLRRNIGRLATEVNHLGTKRDTARVRERVHGLLEESRDLCKEMGDGVKKLQAWDDLTKQQRYEAQKISTEFQSLLQEFQDLQRKALDKERASVAAARQAQEEGGEEGGAEQEQLLQQQTQTQLRLADSGEVAYQEALINEREIEIRNIEQGVGDLNVLFRQVAQIVDEQGEQLNTIAEQVESTHDDTRGADIELRQAARYQKAARNKSCCLLLILGVILTIVILAVVLD